MRAKHLCERCGARRVLNENGFCTNCSPRGERVLALKAGDYLWTLMVSHTGLPYAARETILKIRGEGVQREIMLKPHHKRAQGRWSGFSRFMQARWHTTETSACDAVKDAAIWRIKALVAATEAPLVIADDDELPLQYYESPDDD